VFPEDQRKCIAAGMDMFLTKPLKVDVIRSAIRKAREKVQAVQCEAFAG
jgi:CheY-like chemotaxis protein